MPPVGADSVLLRAPLPGPGALPHLPSFERGSRKAHHEPPGRPAQRARPIWWMAPHGFAIGFLLPMMIVVYFVGYWDNPVFTFRGARYLQIEHLFLGCFLICGMALGSWCGAHISIGTDGTRRWPSENGVQVATWIVGGIALTAYCGWYRETVFVPSNLIGMFTGAWQPSRDMIGKDPGLTSWTNVGPVFFALYGYLLHFGRVKTPMKVLFFALVFLTGIRVYLWTERLAMLEAMVSLSMMMPLFWRKIRPWAEWLLTPLRTMGPYALLPVIILYFGAAEFTRSWQADVYHGRMDFSDFVLGRLAAYYYTSLNNGAGLLAEFNWPTWKGDFAFEWLHRVPFGIGQMVNDLSASGSDPLLEFLIRAGDEEFNNPCGLFSVVVDFGVAGGFTYFLIWGIAAGVAYRDWRQAGVLGFIVYPIMMLSYSEVFRFAYFGHSRSFTWVLGVVIATTVMTLCHRLILARRS